MFVDPAIALATVFAVLEQLLFGSPFHILFSTLSLYSSFIITVLLMSNN
jgi:hypothetical protein